MLTNGLGMHGNAWKWLEMARKYMVMLGYGLGMFVDASEYLGDVWRCLEMFGDGWRILDLLPSLYW